MNDWTDRRDRQERILGNEARLAIQSMVNPFRFSCEYYKTPPTAHRIANEFAGTQLEFVECKDDTCIEHPTKHFHALHNDMLYTITEVPEL